MKPAVLILAAGMASRMGAAKALLSLPSLPEGGRCSALRGLVSLYRSLGVENVVIVSGFHAEVVEAEALALGLSAVRNPDPQRGMFSSVQAGVEALVKGGFEGQFFVQPVDVPLVRPLTIRALLDAAGQEEADHAAALAVSGKAAPTSVLVPTFDGQEGHPPLISMALAQHILTHQGQNGLRGALEGAPLRHVPVADALILEDMDTPDDYARLRVLARERHTLSPVEAECLLCICNVPEKGLRHARAVGDVACCLAEALAHAREAAGYDAGVDPRLALAGGLLHDICKGQPRHEAAAGEFLRRLELPEMARLVQDHRDLSLPEDEPVTERELVYLADKYCYGGNFVPVQRRFGLKLEAYAQDAPACEAIQGRLGRVKALEERIAREIGKEPALVAERALVRNCNAARGNVARREVA